MHIQLSLSRHFYLLYLLLNSCDRNDAKQRVFLGRLLVALKRTGFSLANVHDFMFARNRFLHSPTTLSMTFCDMLAMCQ